LIEEAFRMTEQPTPRSELACFAQRLPLLRRAWSHRHPHQHAMTQERLAEVVGVDARTVREWEKGRNRPRTSRVVDRIAAALEVPSRELGLGSGVAAPAVSFGGERVVLSLDASGRLEARLGVVDAVEAAYAGSGMDRRDFLGLIGALLAALPGSGMEVAERVAHTLSSPRRHVDIATVEAMEQLTTHLCQEGMRIPVHRLLPDARRQMELLVGLEPAFQPSAVQRRLVACIGRTARLISGTMLWDLGDVAGARAYQDIAMRAARESEDCELAALTLAERGEEVAGLVTGRLARALGQRDVGRERTVEALQIVDAAQACAARGTAEAQVRVRLIGAMVNADAGREAHFRRLHDEARRLVTDMGGGDVWTGSIFITEASLLVDEGRGLLWLGQSHVAEPILCAAFDELRADSRNAKYLCFGYGYRAAVLLQREDPEVEEACRCLGEMLDIAIHMHRASGVANVRELHRHLRPWSDTAPVRELTERLAAVPLSS
jgi:transcriptional regulator with XRE-family HTH domain